MSEHLLTYFTDIYDAEARQANWLIEPLLPVGLVIIGGPPKSYKSTISAFFASIVSGHSCELLPPGYQTLKHPTGQVMWFSMEADAGALKDMIVNDIGVDLEMGCINVCADPWAWQLDGSDGDRIFAALEVMKPKLVILDPFRDLHSLDENDSGEMVRVLRPLAQWAHDTDATVLLVHHVSKPAEGQKQYTATNLRGSGAIFGKADGVLTVSPTKVPGRVDIECIVKRGGEKWMRQFALGAFGREFGFEVPDSNTLRAMEAMHKGARGEALMELASLDADSMKQVDAVLTRNAWARSGTLTDEGREYLLTEARRNQGWKK